MAPRATHNTQVVYPQVDSDGLVGGWFRLQDEYLKPEVLYGSCPLITSIKLGGRVIHIDRAVTVHIKLLEEHEDRFFWCSKKQHCDRINLGEYHSDFGDAEVAFSFSSPQTHIWFAGYSIHTEAFESLAFSSHNATVRVRPEHLLGDLMMQDESVTDQRLNYRSNGRHQQTRQLAQLEDSAQQALAHGGGSGRRNSNGRFESTPLVLRGAEEESVQMNRHLEDELLYGQTIDELEAERLNAHGPNWSVRDDLLSSALFSESPAPYVPLYSAQVPRVYRGLAGRPTVEYMYTAQHLNDCEREINLKETYDVGLSITPEATPSIYPPMYPPLRPYEFPQLIHSSANSLTRGGLQVQDSRAWRKTLSRKAIEHGADNLRSHSMRPQHRQTVRHRSPLVEEEKLYKKNSPQQRNREASFLSSSRLDPQHIKEASQTPGWQRSPVHSSAPTRVPDRLAVPSMRSLSASPFTEEGLSAGRSDLNSVYSPQQRPSRSPGQLLASPLSQDYLKVGMAKRPLPPPFFRRRVAARSTSHAVKDGAPDTLAH